MTPRTILTASCLSLFGAALYFAPPGIAEAVRGGMTDFLRPGQQAVSLVKGSSERFLATLSSSKSDPETVLTQLADELELEHTKNRMLQVRLAQLTEKLLPEQDISAAVAKAPRLVLPTLIEVAVLGDAMAEQWRAGKLLDRGAKDGLRESELVLTTRKSNANQSKSQGRTVGTAGNPSIFDDLTRPFPAFRQSTNPLIDCGDDLEISTEDALLIGRCVIGKVEHVGRWSSSVQLVTDARYRGRAQLIQETSDGRFVFGGQGILKGQGTDLCKLDGILAEESVHVGDAVYTADRDGLLPTPLYYGQVVEANLGSEDREWTVVVKPAPLPSHLTTVQVLRTAVNLPRLAVK